MTAVKAFNLKCEHLSNPLGVGTPKPRFSWEIAAEGVGLIQCAFRVQVRERFSPETVLWDSGRVSSSAQHEILYAGLPLKPRSAYAWRVEVWLDDGSSSGWSEDAFFETGFFSIKDWTAAWVAYRWCHVAPELQSVCFLRGEFKVENAAGLRRARAFVSSTAGAHGNDTLRMNLYELRLNGRKVGTDLYNPGQLSELKGRALYRAYDISSHIQEGMNAIGLIFISAKISAEILLEYADGSVVLIPCQLGWRMKLRGPFVRLWRHDVYEYGGKGEHYDAREEFTGWDLPGFDGKDWNGISNYTDPAWILAPQMQSVETYQVLQPERIVKLSGGCFVVDFGHGLNGHVVLHAPGPKGTAIRLRFAEEVHPDGSIDASSTFSAQREKSIHEDLYIKRGDGVEDYAPHFANHGFRYVEVTGWAGDLKPSDLHANAVCSAVGCGSSFDSSDEYVMKLHQLCERTFRSNLMSVPTDCPSRERQGWPGDNQLCVAALCALFDMRLFYEKWFDDMDDSQAPNGCLPYLTPFPKVLIGSDIAWSTGFVVMAWETWLAYGDRSALERHYDDFVRWAEFLVSIQEANGLSRGHCNYCDHLAKDYPAREFIENVYAFHSFTLLAKIAGALGRQADASKFEGHAATLKNSINSHLLHKGVYGLGTQSEAVHALAFGLAPEELRRPLFAQLCKQLEEERFLRTGILGTFHLLQLLADEGRNDLVWKLVKSEKPYTWGYWLTLGATCAYEEWVPHDSFSSHNHPAFVGGLAAWLYREFAGIKPLTPGYGIVGIKPFAPEGVDHASAKVKTPFGYVCSSWRRAGEGLKLDFEIPVGMKAEVQLPGFERPRIFGSGRHSLG